MSLTDCIVKEDCGVQEANVKWDGDTLKNVEDSYLLFIKVSKCYGHFIHKYSGFFCINDFKMSLIRDNYIIDFFINLVITLQFFFLSFVQNIVTLSYCESSTVLCIESRAYNVIFPGRYIIKQSELFHVS